MPLTTARHVTAEFVSIGKVWITSARPCPPAPPRCCRSSWLGAARSTGRPLSSRPSR